MFLPNVQLAAIDLQIGWFYAYLIIVLLLEKSILFLLTYGLKVPSSCSLHNFSSFKQL